MRSYKISVLVVLALLLSLGGTSCGQPSLAPTDAATLPVATPSPMPTATVTPPRAPTATSTTPMSPRLIPSPTATSTAPTSPFAIPSPTATTETSPLPTLAVGSLTFDGGAAYNYVLEQCAFGPRPTGSEAGWATGDYLIAQLAALDWQVVVHEFSFQGVKGRNIVGKRGSGPVAMLGAHYDTRPYADHNSEGEREQWILGANDGASGVAVLLELARILEVEKTGREIWITFFDAEDRGRLDDWPFSVGASVLASDLHQSNLPQLTQTPEFVIVVDMVGDAEQQIYYEGLSDPRLNEHLWSLAHSLGYESVFVPAIKHEITDDHQPFLQVGIPAIDIIDFDYPYWHTTQDTPDKVSPASLERVGRVLELFLESGGTWQP